TLTLPPDAGKSERLLDEERSLTGYRIIQECLTNVARHSKAKSVAIAFALSVTAKDAKPDISITIEDDGIGLPCDFRFGFGFLGMSERVRKLGGRLDIDKGRRGGTLIRATIPASDAPNVAGLQGTAAATSPA
ncbi:MAG: ATP-binding protein, partial [Methylovirgula sp.]